MDREQHLQWAKDRAIEILRTMDNASAWTSFVSDMGKHEKLKDHKALDMGMMMLIGGMWQSESDCEKFILGFN